jgi:K+-transporting ATPase A subunit
MVKIPVMLVVEIGSVITMIEFFAASFENPTGFTNIFDLLLVIVLPFAIVVMFGRLIGRRRQAW